jgi:putative inorganic carbon (HCO3(-)) transporter
MRSNIKQAPKNSNLGFFFLFLYTIAVLVRPHEMFLVSEEWILIKIFAIIALLGLLIGQRPIDKVPQHYFLLALVPLIIVSGFFNGSGFNGITESQMLLISSIIPLFLYSNLISSIKKQHLLMMVCLVAALLMVHNGYSQQINYDLGYKMGQGWAGSFSVGRADMRITYLGFFNDPNDLGMFLVMNIPFACYFMNRGKSLTKLTMLFALTAIGYGIYMTGSRGTMLGAGALAAAYFLVVNAGPKLFIASITFAPIAAVVVASLQSNIDASADGRLEAWYAGILMLLSNPILGVGKGNFLEEHGLVAHNSYIHVAAELGIPGYSLWGGALIFTALSSYYVIKFRVIKKTSEVNDENIITPLSEEKLAELAINKTLFFSLVGYMVTAFFLSRMFTLLLFIFMGMAIASQIRLVKLMPELQIHFDKSLAIKSIGYCWVIIVAVYIALKMGL